MAVLRIFDDIAEPTLYAVANFADSLADNDEGIIEIASHGGLVFLGTGTCQKIQEAQNRGCKFTAKVYGVAASSAADICLACDTIKMANNSAIMIHSSYNAEGSKDKGIEIANDAQLAVIHKRLPTYTAKDLETDRWFTSSEALSLGICDEVFGVDRHSPQARLCARYLAKTDGGFTMPEKVKAELKAEFVEEKEEKEKVEEKAEEVVEEKEEIKEEKAPTVEEVIEKVIERIDDMDARLAKLEGACGDGERKDEARMKAVWKKLTASITKPVEVPTNNAVSTPEAELERYKASYGNMNFDYYINN